ncbi:32744_t:CDS:2 [Gigaspora margarita]|uniref:32744_t:CDS:1 n=1 Tax=Gigaspora margarita TaxID=4874 RepID=A0ABN7VXQ1_GIGMA|nr:32744_t:CDS:2 [Gigaspora margarita]
MEQNQYQRKRKNHPPQEVINKIREELSAPDYPYKIIGLPENPTAEEKFKYEICQNIARYKRENNLTEEELENKIGANLQYTHYILHGIKIVAETEKEKSFSVHN